MTVSLNPLFLLPFNLPPESKVLVAGCGGGYDIVCGLPVALALRNAGHHVSLASYSFTAMSDIRGATTDFPGLWRIDEGCAASPETYFPEGHLSRWWSCALGEERPIWCYSGIGVRPLSAIFQHLARELSLDAIIVVDGGVDGLFLGNEYDTGTPSIDAISILAAHTVTGCIGIYAFTAFGTEGRAYSVRHADALMRMAALVAQGALLGSGALSPGSAEGIRFLDAVDSIHMASQPLHRSNMAASLAAALRGCFGETDITVKTQGAPVWVSPLTLLYWFLDLAVVAQAKPYRGEVMESEDVFEVNRAIERYRESAGILPRQDIPI